MSDPYPSSQFELFPGIIGNSQQKTDSRVLLRSLTISIENFFVLAVVIVIGMVAAFSIGVERGKRAALRRVQPTQLSGKIPIRDVPNEPGVPVAVRPPALPEEEELPAGEPVRTDAAPPEEAAVAASGADKAYTVQVASFRKEQQAHQEADGLKKNGYDIYVLPKGNYSIVCVGKFAQHGQAKEFSQRLRKKYKDCLVRRL